MGCDAFFSHSWHDDGSLKKDALKCWCDNFRSIHGCSPHLWLDKVCICQADVKADLQCLPIFLAGCNLLFVVSGLTFVSRLWCCVELFVYDAMLVEDPRRGAPVVYTIAANDDEHELVRASWKTFDAKASQCFDQRDKARIMAVIERHPDGVIGFNRHVKDL